MPLRISITPATSQMRTFAGQPIMTGTALGSSHSMHSYPPRRVRSGDARARTRCGSRLQLVPAVRSTPRHGFDPALRWARQAATPLRPPRCVSAAGGPANADPAIYRPGSHASHADAQPLGLRLPASVTPIPPVACTTSNACAGFLCRTPAPVPPDRSVVIAPSPRSECQQALIATRRHHCSLRAADMRPGQNAYVAALSILTSQC